MELHPAPECPMRALGIQHSDAARRASDTWNLHRAAGLYAAIGKWFASRLDDGSTDGVIYDRKQDAIRHQRGFEYYYAFFCITIAQANPCDTEIFLSVQRRMYERGIRMTDPDARNGGPDVIKRASREDMLPLATRLRGQNLILPEGI